MFSIVKSSEIDIEDLWELNQLSGLDYSLTGIAPVESKQDLIYREQLNARLWQEGTKKSYVVIKEEELIGRIVFENSSNSSVNTAYWLKESCRGKGFMAVILRMGLIEVFKNKEVNICYASCLESNFFSEKVLRKVGFEFIGKNKKNAKYKIFLINRKKFFNFL